MIRAILPTAAVAIAITLITPAAEACISCEYVPEVVRSSSTLNDSKSYNRERAYTHERRTRAAKRSISRQEAATPKAVQKTIAKPVDNAAQEPTKSAAENENSTLTTAAGSEHPAKKVDTAAATNPGGENGFVRSHPSATLYE